MQQCHVEPDDHLIDWGRAWVFRRFGVPGLIVLACASAALFAGTQWGKVSNWPGVRAIVEYASRESVPKADPERFYVVANSILTLRRKLVQPGLKIDARRRRDQDRR